MRASRGRADAALAAVGGLQSQLGFERDGAEIDPRSRSGWSPLQYAGQFGHTDALRGMIKLGADVNHLGDGGWHALFDACMNGHDESVLALNKASRRGPGLM